MNDERAADEAQIVERKNVVAVIKEEDGTHTGLTARSVTSSCVLPMKLRTLYDAQPFYIAACELLLELTSIVADVLPDDEADDEDGQKAAAANKRGPYEFRPDLVCHDEDLRNLVSVRDYDSTLDGMSSFDIINSSPTVEVRGKESSPVVSSPSLATHTPPSRFAFRRRARSTKSSGRQGSRGRTASRASRGPCIRPR